MYPSHRAHRALSEHLEGMRASGHAHKCDDGDGSYGGGSAVTDRCGNINHDARAQMHSLLELLLADPGDGRPSFRERCEAMLRDVPRKGTDHSGDWSRRKDIFKAVPDLSP